LQYNALKRGVRTRYDGSKLFSTRRKQGHDHEHAQLHDSGCITHSYQLAKWEFLHMQRAQDTLDEAYSSTFDERALPPVNLEWLLEFGVFDDVILPHDADNVFDSQFAR
jgi:hypothetical protein